MALRGSKPKQLQGELGMGPLGWRRRSRRPSARIDLFNVLICYPNPFEAVLAVVSDLCGRSCVSAEVLNPQYIASPKRLRQRSRYENTHESPAAALLLGGRFGKVEECG